MTNKVIVRNTDDHVSLYDKNKIVDSIYTEINFVSNAFNGGGELIKKSEAHFIANKVEKVLNKMDSKYLSGALIRELVSMELLKFDQKRSDNTFQLKKYYSRVGLPLYEVIRIITGDSDITTDNANQSPNPETVQNKFAGAAAKEAALLLLPHHLADKHLSGDYHIHDREYFLTRTFCMDHDLRFFFYYGLDPDCTGRTNIASSAKNAEVAILHAAKVLGSAQTNFAGGQGFYNFLTFLAPYFEHKTYLEIEHLMQMFVYEIAQTMCARGAQVVFSSVQLSPGVPKIWKDKPAVFRGILWNGENGNEYRPYGDFEREVRLAFRALMKVMLEGDAWGKPFNFPKPEIAIEREFLIPHEEDDYYEQRHEIVNKTKVWEPKYESLKTKREEQNVPMTYYELYDLPLELVVKFGTPYFDNVIPDYRQTDGISCYQCLSGNEEVILENGNIKIQELYEFFEKEGRFLDENVVKSNDVKCLTTKGFQSYEGVRKVKHNGRLLIITTETGRSITCTPDHELFTVNGKISAESLKLGDSILTSVRCKICNKELKQITNTHVKTHGLTVEDYIEKYGIEGTVGEQLNITQKRKSKAMEGYWSTQPQEYVDELTQKRMKGFQEYWNSLTKEEQIQQKKDASIGRWARMSDEMKRDVIKGPRQWNRDTVTKEEQIMLTELKKILPNSNIHHNKSISNNSPIIEAKPWIADICIDNKVIVECDGEYWHSLPNVIEKDKRKDIDLMEQGYSVIRLMNFEISTNLEMCVNKVVSAVKANSRYEEITSITEKHFDGHVYDLVEVDKTNAFITGNNIVSSNCCAYNFSTGPDKDEFFEDKLNFLNGAHFSMGGAQVVSMNVVRAAYESIPGDFEDLMKNTKKLVDYVAQVHCFKKKIMKKLWNQNGMPFATQQLTHPITMEVSPPLVDFEELVYLVGVIGVNEVAEVFTGVGLDTKEGFNFAMRYLNNMNSIVKEKAAEYDIKLVLARTPAETTAQRFAVLDLLHYEKQARKHVKGDVRKAMNEISHTKNLPVYYSNGTHLPVDTHLHILERLEIEEMFFPVLGGGNIFHIWLGENHVDVTGLHEFFNKAVSDSLLGYFAFTKDFSICNACKTQEPGIIEKCTFCKSTDVDSFSRITGYIQSIKGWNEAKKQELKDRTRTTSLI